MGVRAVVAVVILIAVLIGLSLLLYKTNIIGMLLRPNYVYVSGVSLEINDVNPISCFGNAVQPLPGFNITRGSAFTYTFNLTNTCQQSHNVTNISVINSGFTTKVINPRLQYQVFNGNRVPFTLRISAPSSFHGGVINLQVNVT